MLEILFSEWGIGSIVTAVVLSAIYYFRCARTITTLNTELKKISGAPGVDAALSKSELLAPAWKAFEKTLTNAKDGKVYSTTDASEFFNVTGLTRGMNMTFWQGYGGIFTGLGILGTFAGLTSGLSGVNMTSGNIDVLKGSIANLLSGVESAFVTSLVGIGCALVYSGVHHYLLVKLQENVRRLTEELDKKFPRRSIEGWLSKNLDEAQAQSTTLQSINGQVATENDWLEKNHGEAQAQTTALQSIDTNIDSQKAILQNIGEDVANAIYEGLDNRMDAAVENLCNKLEEKLLPQTDKICGSIEKLDANLITAIGKIDPAVDRICAAIDKLGAGGSEAIGEIFTKGVGAQMERFSSALDRFSDSIDKKLEAANEIAKIMNEQLLNTLKDLNDALKNQADASANERDAEYKRFTTALEELIGTLQAVADKIKAQHETSAKDFTTLLQTSLDNFSAVMTQILTKVQIDTDKAKATTQEASDQFLTMLAGLSKTLQEVADKIKNQQESSSKEFVTLLQTALDNFNAVMTQVLKNSKQTSEETNQQFLMTLAALNNTLQKVADKIAEHQTSSIGNFDSLIKNLIAKLENFTETQQKLLGNLTSSNAAQIGEAVKAFRAIVDAHNEATSKTFRQVQTLLNETKTFLDNIDDASRSLKTAADPVKQSTLQLTQNLRDTSTQIGRLAAVNQTTRDNLSDLSTRLADFVAKFNGIADELERSTKTIHDCLDNYNVKTSKELSKALTDFGNAMTQALGGLEQIVEDFSETVGYVKQKRR